METSKGQPKALIVGIQLPKVSDLDLQYSLAELKRLVDTLGYQVIGQVTQKRSGTGSAAVVGEGKLRELARWSGGSGEIQATFQKKKSKALERREADAMDAEEDSDPSDMSEADEESESADSASSAEPTDRAEFLIFDCELSPSQMRNLESATGAKILDRTGVIIEIFSRHARTRAAKLQVEIARLNYIAPRLRETGSSGGDREGGGIGGKGAGESSQELDRRRIRDRIKELKIELESIQDEGALRRQRRSTENAVALVGYTNAGKSSLMRALTGSEILVADKLFATLDTTVRPLHPASVPKVLVSDTVGFIKKLPHDLVASFRSTLEEALNADLLLYIVDASDPTFREQLEVTKTVLKEIGAEEMQSWLILNKRDRLNEVDRAKLATEFPDAKFLSTITKEDIKIFREKLIGFFEKDFSEEKLLVPYAMKGAIGEIRRNMRVLEETYDESGVTLRVRARPEDLARVRARCKI